jgi:hypothetical protein
MLQLKLLNSSIDPFLCPPELVLRDILPIPSPTGRMRGMHSILSLPDLLNIPSLSAHLTLDFLKPAHQPVVLFFLLFLGQFDFLDFDVEQSGFLNGAFAVLALSEHLLDHAFIELAFPLRVNQLLLEQHSLLLTFLQLCLAQFELLAHLVTKVLVLLQLRFEGVDVGCDFFADGVDLLFAVLLRAGLYLVVLGLVVRREAVVHPLLYQSDLLGDELLAVF